MWGLVKKVDLGRSEVLKLIFRPSRCQNVSKIVGKWLLGVTMLTHSPSKRLAPGNSEIQGMIAAHALCFPLKF